MLWLTLLSPSTFQIRMQMVCLLIGVLSIRMVKRFKVQSASLFDRRKNAQHSNSTTSGGAGEERRVRYAQVSREDSMETIELIRGRGSGKVPKSPAPEMQTV